MVAVPGITPRLCSRDDLRQVLGIAFDERQALERLFAANRPPPLDRPRTDLQRIAVLECAFHAGGTQRTRSRGRDGDGDVGLVCHGLQRSTKAAPRCDVGIQKRRIWVWDHSIPLCRSCHMAAYAALPF